MIGVVGVSHHTAGIELRERVAMPKEQVVELIEQLKQGSSVKEVLVLSTCNRVEVLVAGSDETLSDATSLIKSELDKRAPGIASHLYVHVGRDAVRHVFRVASSLDSMVLGEPQILGQFKQAFEIARSAGSLGGKLHRVVSRAIRAAKHVRSETSIGSGQVSVPSVAVDLARQIFGDLRGRVALLVGSGEMAETVARLLVSAGSRCLILGRNENRVNELVQTIGGAPRLWQDLTSSLEEADVVITSTSASGFVIDRPLVDKVKRSRRGRSLFFIDLAVPRDVEPSVEQVDGVFVYNVDDFSRVVSESRALREREADRAEQIVTGEVLGFERWVEAERVTPAIVALRARFEHVLRAELERSLKGRLKHLGIEDREALEVMLQASVKKLLHGPTQKLRQSTQPGEVDLAGIEPMLELLLELFELEEGAQDGEPSDAAESSEAAEPADELDAARTEGS